MVCITRENNEDNKREEKKEKRKKKKREPFFCKKCAYEWYFVVCITRYLVLYKTTYTTAAVVV